MKKLVLGLAIMCFSLNVHALTGVECSKQQMEEGQILLKEVTHNLEYADNYVDMNGDFQESYMRIKFPALPAGYYARLATKEGALNLRSAEQFAFIKGGVHRIEFYSEACDSVIKSYEIMVPHYKQYCGLNVKCEDNAFFDGTYENSATNQNKKPKSKLSLKLIIILVVLISIIVGFVVFVIKRRKDLEKDL